MEKILIIYCSGVGNTKMVAEKIYQYLKENYITDLFCLENLPNVINFSDYRGVAIGFPTIHTHPAKRILQFVDNLKPLSNSIPAFIFTTCGLYSANTLRIFAKRCARKNINTVVYNDYRCAATDGTLLAPCMGFWFNYEKGLDDKILKDCTTFNIKLKRNISKLNIPRFKLYSILNYPNKLVGQHYTFPIYLFKDKCVQCGKCIKNCPTNALQKEDKGYPIFSVSKCENCYRCIHHCPTMALSLSKKKSPQKLLGS